MIIIAIITLIIITNHDYQCQQQRFRPINQKLYLDHSAQTKLKRKKLSK